MFSGLYPHTLGKVAHMRTETDSRLKTLTHFFIQAGYRTGIVGKTHFWPPDETYGSDYVRLTIDRQLCGELGQNDAYLAYLDKMQLKGVKDESRIPLEHYRTVWTAKETSDFLRSGDGRPFFLFCSFVKPHPPYDPPAPFDTYYTSADLPEPRARRSELTSKPHSVRNKMNRSLVYDRERGESAARRYFGLVSLIDRSIGEIMNTLSDTGERENTIVLFTSDHGEFLGDHFMTGKEFFYEASASIPLIFNGPGVYRGGVTSALAGHVDLLPTLLDIAGLEVPKRRDGISLGEVLQNPDKNTERDVLFGELHRGIRTDSGIWWIGQRMATDRRYKYIYYVNAWKTGGTEEELYDLIEDGAEFNNLADEKPQVCRRLRDALLAWEINSLPNSLYPIDDRYPLAHYVPEEDRVEYRGGASPTG
jgi:arylsulfatase A-like enzyme